MSEPIKVGDLVMVVRGHECVVAKVGGVPYTVAEILPQKFGGWYCPVCHSENIGQTEAFGAKLMPLHFSRDCAIPLGWLKRIPPPSELESEKRDETVSA